MFSVKKISFTKPRAAASFLKLKASVERTLYNESNIINLSWNDAIGGCNNNQAGSRGNGGIRRDGCLAFAADVDF